LAEADFVTTQFRVGLLEARIKDERIPLSHGILGQETNGAGGIFKAFRTIPVILEIIDDMKELCPEAWLINFTNPSGMVTEAAIKVGGWKRTIGLCNVPINHILKCAEVLDVTADELVFRFAGLNHFHWHRVWDRSGKELTAELIDTLYHPDSVTEDKEAFKNIPHLPLPYEVIKDSGILPCGYHRYYYAQEEMTAHAVAEFRQGRTRGQLVKETERRLFELYQNPELNYKPKELENRGGTHYSDTACEVISSIYNNKGSDLVVSTQNKGAVCDLPFDCVVEVSAALTSHGPEPYTWGRFAPASRSLLQGMKGMEETVIQAAISGDYGKALHAFTVNSLIPGGAIARRLLDELLVAHKNYLPQFASAIEQIEKERPETAAYVEMLMKTN